MMKDVDEGLGGTSSATLVSAMRILANEIQSDDGVANAAIREAADRIEQLETSIKQIHKDYGCEIRDPCGTIWEYASRLEKENAELKSRVVSGSTFRDRRRRCRARVFGVQVESENNARTGDGTGDGTGDSESLSRRSGLT